MFGIKFEKAIKLITVCALVCAFALCALTAAACKKQGGGSGGPAEETQAAEQGDGLTSEQRARILELAAAFRQFGEYDRSEGVTFDKLEYIVFCMFADKVKESEPEGFGSVSAEEADRAIQGVFGNITIMDVMRREYDEEAEQTYYFKDGEYKVMITDNSAYTYSIVSAETAEDGKVTAQVEVKRGGADELTLTLTLQPNGEYVYRVEKCAVNMWY